MIVYIFFILHSNQIGVLPIILSIISHKFSRNHWFSKIIFLNSQFHWTLHRVVSSPYSLLIPPYSLLMSSPILLSFFSILLFLFIIPIFCNTFYLTSNFFSFIKLKIFIMLILYHFHTFQVIEWCSFLIPSLYLIAPSSYFLTLFSYLLFPPYTSSLPANNVNTTAVEITLLFWFQHVYMYITSYALFQ